MRKAQRALDRRQLGEDIDTEDISESSYVTTDNNSYSGPDDKVVAYVKNYIPRYKKASKNILDHFNADGTRKSHLVIRE